MPVLMLAGTLFIKYMFINIKRLLEKNCFRTCLFGTGIAINIGSVVLKDRYDYKDNCRDEESRFVVVFEILMLYMVNCL